MLSARAYHPQDEPKVELSVLLVDRWILARLRKFQFARVQEVNDAIAPLLQWLNQRPFQKLPGSRASVFTQIDAPTLRALPVLELRVTAHAVEVLHRGLRVASHMHCAHKGGFTAVTEHLPDRHQHQAQWTPERLLAWGQRIGPACASTVQKMLERQLHAEHAYRPCLGLQSLCKRHGDARLEAACTLALSLGTCKYTHIRYILANRRDLLQASTTPQWTSPLHAHVRGPGYYQ